jgi:L-amino acid N-acyltransferase YncA
LHNAGTVLIRAATEQDWAQIWPFFHQIVAAGDTYGYDPDIGEGEARSSWMQKPPGATFVAVDDGGGVVGTAQVHPNQGGNGSHVANGSYMVNPAKTGRGVGRALGQYSLAWARAHGYRAMQFNAVVETNERAVALWKNLGFEILATVPEAFRHPDRGYVGVHIMYRTL